MNSHAAGQLSVAPIVIGVLHGASVTRREYTDCSMKRYVITFGALGLVIALCGCSLFESRETRQLRETPDYRAGYSDGCATANAAGTAGSQGITPIRDDNAFRTNKAYNLGWTTGHSMCRNTFTPAPGSGPLPNITH